MSPIRENLPLPCLGVAGLGALGGSVARQAREAGIPRVIGWSPGPDGAAAFAANAVTALVESPAELASEADLIVLAAPPIANTDLLKDVGLPGGSGIITDVTSVQSPMLRRAAELGLEDRFVGSHPLCGTHQSGFEAARFDLFRDAVVYVCAPDPASGAAQRVAAFWRDAMGARPVFVAADEHDRLVAWSSHLPQAVASALAAALAESAPPDAQFGPGARDTTRIAAGNPEMWRDVFTLNAEPVLEAIDGFAGQLNSLRAAIADGDGARIADWFARGAHFRRRLDS